MRQQDIFISLDFAEDQNARKDGEYGLTMDRVRIRLLEEAVNDASGLSAESRVEPTRS